MNILILTGAALSVALYMRYRKKSAARQRASRQDRWRCDASCAREAHPWDVVPEHDPRSAGFPAWLIETHRALPIPDDQKERLMLANTRQLLDDLIAKNLVNGHDARHLLDAVKRALRGARLSTDTPLF